MGDQRQEFTNNFNNYESTRFDFGIAMLMTLFSKENQESINGKIREQLIEVQTVKDSSNPIKGLVYANETDDLDKFRIFYINYNPDKVAYSWHNMVHELTHFIGKPSKETLENELNENSDKSELGGTRVFDYNTNSEYGNFFNECGADLIAEMAMTTSIECRETNPNIKSADDIIYTSNRYQKTDYDYLSTIARLMTVAMDNNFSNQSYDKMIHSDSGLIDRQVQMVNQETGQIIDTVPTNDYLYAMSGHGKHLEERFDKYSENGNYREMCSVLDSEIKAIQKSENHTIDKDKIKEQLLKIADMVNNKMYILQSDKCITQEQKNAFVGRFNLVFNQVLQEYDIGPLTIEDIKKTTKSMNETRNIKLQKQSTVKESSFESKAKDNVLTDLNSKAEFENNINERQEDKLEPGKQNESRLSLKQRIAKFLQKNNIFMNMSFVENFVHQQLDVLPESTQEQKTAINILREQKQAFDDRITGNGAYQNLPPIQRMSDPQKIQDMQRKMGQVEKEDDGMDR